MAQNEESIKSLTKSPNSHLPCVTCPDNSISSFDLLNSYRSSGNNQAVVSAAAAAIILQAAADSQNPRKSMTLPSVSPLSTSGIKQRCSSPSDGENTASAAASLMSRPRQHSPTTSSKIQAALVMAMAASSPPSTCPSSSSSGHQGEHGTNDFRSDAQPPLGAFFRPPPPTAYETVDGGGNGPGDGGFQPPGSGNLPPFVPFTSSSAASPDMSASACLTNAMLLPASIVNVLGQQMQSNQYHQPQSPAYLSTIGSNSAGGGFPHQPQTPGGAPPGLGGADAQAAAAAAVFQSVAGGIPATSPSNTDASRYSAPCRSGSTALHEDSNNKREQRLLKNREAARECRRKKKEYVRCLERQVTILQNQNHQLIEELQKMKALCAGALLDPSGQPPQLQGAPNLANSRHLGGDDGGMDFVDSAHRKPRLPPSPQRGDGSGGRNSYHASASSTSSAIMVDSGDSSVVRQLPNELTLLKSPVSQAQQQQQQQLLLLQGLSALKERGGGMRKNEENNYPPQAAVTGGGWADQKPKFPADDLDTRPPSSSPHIHPVKRALKRFGNEQHRLSQQQQASGKPDSDKTH